MKIAINVRFLSRGPLEGIPRYTWETTRRLIEEHPEASFYLFFDRPFDKKYVDFPNATGIHIPPPARHPILWNIWFDYSVPYYLKKYDIDVFYSPDGYASLKTDVPTIMVTHDLAYIHYPEYSQKRHIRYLKKRVPKFHDKASKIIAVSETTKKDIIKQLNVEPDKILVAYNALPAKDPIEEIESPFSFPYILYLGAIHPRKNILNLVKAYELFVENNPHSNLRLVLAGRKAWDNDSLDNYVNKSPVRSKIIFTGMVSESMKHNLYKNAELFCYVSLFEGFGIPVLEAFSYNIPVITSKNTSMQEIAQNSAICVNPYMVDKIAEAIQTIVYDPILINNLISSGKKQLNRFNWDDSSKTIYKAILEIAH